MTTKLLLALLVLLSEAIGGCRETPKYSCDELRQQDYQFYQQERKWDLARISRLAADSARCAALSGKDSAKGLAW